MNIDLLALEKSLQEKKYDDARKILQSLVEAKLSSEEKGALYTDFAMTYMQVTNMINLYYKKALETAVSTAKEIDAKIVQMDDVEKLAKIRADLSA